MNGRGIPAVARQLVLAAWVAAPAWANSLPILSNVTASQRTDGSQLVDILYDLQDDDDDACTISVLVTDDGGATWAVRTTALSGAVGPGVTAGTGKAIVWDTAADLPLVFGSQFQVRICADDGYGLSGMAVIPEGEFQMGDALSEGGPEEQPVHAVQLDTFYINHHHVTHRQYAAALNWAGTQGGLITVINGVIYQTDSGTGVPYASTAAAPAGFPEYGEYSGVTWDGATFGAMPGKENHPAVMTSWYGAAAYTNWRSAMQGRQLCYDLTTWACDFNANGYRLPTEAEWEKAARGGVAGQRFPWADTNTVQHARANYFSSGADPYDDSPTQGYHPTFDTGTFPYTSPVGSFAPNGYGLYDMAGNAWDWCNDWYDLNYYSTTPYPHVNPTGPAAGTFRVVRGGSWFSFAANLRCAFRDGYEPDFRFHFNGFRLVSSVAPEAGAGCADSDLFTIKNCVLVRPDFDEDCDVDNADFEIFDACAAGPAVPYVPTELCPATDLDGDGDADLVDFAIFQRCVSGENNPPDPNCEN